MQLPQCPEPPTTFLIHSALAYFSLLTAPQFCLPVFLRFTMRTSPLLYTLAHPHTLVSHQAAAHPASCLQALSGAPLRIIACPFQRRALSGAPPLHYRLLLQGRALTIGRAASQLLFSPSRCSTSHLRMCRPCSFPRRQPIRAHIAFVCATGGCPAPLQLPTLFAGRNVTKPCSRSHSNLCCKPSLAVTKVLGLPLSLLVCPHLHAL